jgi:hypothetical protein
VDIDLSGPPVHLKGRYIELGIASSGKFGVEVVPNGFHGRRNGLPGFGMLSDADGFDMGNDIRVDFEMPAYQGDRFMSGFTALDNSVHQAMNFASTVVNTSSAGVSSARIEGTVGGVLEVTQRVGFRNDDRAFRTIVTLKNTGSDVLNKVRYVHQMDPDNSWDMDRYFSTYNTIVKAFKDGDNAAAVSAMGPVWGPYTSATWGKQSLMMYISGDPSATTSHFNDWWPVNEDIYYPKLVENTPNKGTTNFLDSFVSITFDIGTLNPGSHKTVSFWTVMSYGTTSTPYWMTSHLTSVVGCRSIHPTVTDAWCRGSWPTLPTNCFDGAGQIAPACRYTIDPPQSHHRCEC